jgi:hypothetical protein
MRKIGLLFLGVIILYSQDYQKDFFVAGQFNFSSLNSDIEIDGESRSDGSNQSLLVNSELGYVVFANFATGLNIKLVKSNFEGEANSSQTSTTLAWGPFVRYYFFREKIAPFAQVAANYSNSEVVSDDSNHARFEYSSYQYTFSIGSHYFVTEYVSFVAQTAYSLGEINSTAYIPDILDSDSDEEFTEFSITLGLSLHF